jgi:hypothetical protein
VDGSEKVSLVSIVLLHVECFLSDLRLLLQ